MADIPSLQDIKEEVAAAAESELHLSYYQLNNECVQFLAKSLKDPELRIGSVQLRWCKFVEEDGIVEIMQAIADPNSAVEEISLTGYLGMEARGMKALAHAITQSWTKVRSLILDDCNVGDLEGFVYLADALTNAHNKIEEFTLSECYIGGLPGMERLANILKHPHNKIRQLSLENCNLERIPMYVLQGRVRCDLCDNRKVRSGYHAKPKRDLCIPCFTKLKKGNDEISPEMGEAMKEANIAPNDLSGFVFFSPEFAPILGTITLRPMEGLEGMRLLAGGLGHENCKVSNLQLRRTEFEEVEGMRVLTELLKKPGNTLEALSFQKMSLGGAHGLRLLTQALQHDNNRVRNLDLSAFQTIDTEPMLRFVHSFQHPSNNVRVLCLAGITNEIGRELLGVIRHSLLQEFSCNVDEELDIDVLEELGRITALTESDWFSTVLTLCSVRQFPRLGMQSNFRVMPLELVRKIAETLPEYEIL